MAPHPPITRAPAPVADAPGNEFPKTFRANFLRGCELTSTVPGYCSCALDKVQKSYSYIQAVKIDRRVRRYGIYAEPRFLAIGQQCLNELFYD